MEVITRDTEEVREWLQAEDLSDGEEDLPEIAGPKREYEQRVRERALEVEAAETLELEGRRIALKTLVTANGHVD